MSVVEEFVGYIAGGERCLAEKKLEELAKNAPCSEYADALRKVFLADIAKKLNKNVDGFYCDTDRLIKSMFSSEVSEKEVVELLCNIARDCSKEAEKTAFEKARNYIAENLCNCQLSVSGAAEYAGATRSNLTKLFKSYAQITPGEYIGKLRCEKSKEFLESGYSVENASEMVGFSSSSGYIRTFKRYIGKTPGEWKRNKLFL